MDELREGGITARGHHLVIDPIVDFARKPTDNMRRSERNRGGEFSLRHSQIDGAAAQPAASLYFGKSENSIHRTPIGSGWYAQGITHLPTCALQMSDEFF